MAIAIAMTRYNPFQRSSSLSKSRNRFLASLSTNGPFVIYEDPLIRIPEASQDGDATEIPRDADLGIAPKSAACRDGHIAVMA